MRFMASSNEDARVSKPFVLSYGDVVKLQPIEKAGKLTTFTETDEYNHGIMTTVGAVSFTDERDPEAVIRQHLDSMEKDELISFISSYFNETQEKQLTFVRITSKVLPHIGTLVEKVIETGKHIMYHDPVTKEDIRLL